MITDLLEVMGSEDRREFFGDFAADSLDYIESLYGVKTVDDAHYARSRMHALVGAASTIGAKKLAQLARNIEELPDESLLKLDEELLGEISAVLRETNLEIEARLL